MVSIEKSITFYLFLSVPSPAILTIVVDPNRFLGSPNRVPDGARELAGTFPGHIQLQSVRSVLLHA